MWFPIVAMRVRPRQPGETRVAWKKRARGAGPSARSRIAIWAIATALRQAAVERAIGGKRPPRMKENCERWVTTPQIEAGKRPERERLSTTSATLSWPWSDTPFDTK